jgi:hypothetical protein
MTYEEWKRRMPSRGPFASRKAFERQGDPVIAQTQPKVCVIVNSTLYSSIQASIAQYASDLEAEGYALVVHSTSGGTPSDIRLMLQGELSDNLVGCLLVGDLPVPWYEMYDDFDGQYSEFPIDLYYMDLDGQWTDVDADGMFDAHTDGTGDVGPDIWVGRLTASPLSGNQVARIQNYFHKDHLYRIGQLDLSHRALSYVYDDWSSNGDGASDLDLVYGDNVTVMDAKGETSAADYRQRLEETHRFVHVMAHSSPWGHSFSRGWVSSTEIEAIDPRALFYNLFACSNARYVEDDYMGGHYVFAPTHGLAAIGSTKTGSMLWFDQFYGPLGRGESLGEAYLLWFDYIAQGEFELWERQWHYGMTLLGDPTLTVVDPLAPTASILSPTAHQHLHATTTISGTASDASFDSYTLEYGPGTRPVTWTQLIRSSNPVIRSTLATWDTRAFRGICTFRLTVNTNGRSNEDRITARIKNAEIASPTEGDVFTAGERIPITGTALGADFQDYTLEYGRGENPTHWAWIGHSTTSVADSLLATWDTSSITEADYYTIKLTMHGTGYVSTDTVKFVITTHDTAYLQSNAYAINYDDINNDGTVNPGEYVAFSITLGNVGILEAPGVTAALSTVDPCIEYYDTAATSFGDIVAGETVTCGSYDYYFRVTNTCPHHHTVTFDLDISDSNGHTWADDFDVPIVDNVGPAISDAVANPRYVTAGELVTITAHGEDGSGIRSVQAVIESPDQTPIITVTLYDDGAHHDGKAHDGTYGHIWTTDLTPRKYYVDFVTEDRLSNVREHENVTRFTTQAFSKTADILLVADNYTYDTEWLLYYYTEALDTLGCSYDVWDSHLYGLIDAHNLKQYIDGTVLWAAPYWGYIIYDTAQASLKSYLDGGGSLFLSSQDAGYYLYDWGNTDFLNGYLYADFVQGDAESLALNGVSDDPIGDHLRISITGGDGANNQGSPDEISPIFPAVPVLTYVPSGIGGLRVDTGSYKVVYFAFGHEAVNNASDRATLLRRIIVWLQGVRPPVASFTSSSPDWLGQETTFSNTTVVTGSVSYLWAFGDGSTSALKDPTHTYAAPGTYTVTLAATNLAGSDTAIDTVAVLQKNRIYFPLIVGGVASLPSVVERWRRLL